MLEDLFTDPSWPQVVLILGALLILGAVANARRIADRTPSTTTTYHWACGGCTLRVSAPLEQTVLDSVEKHYTRCPDHRPENL